MSHKIPHTTLRTDTYYYNRRVPRHAVEGFGMKAVQVALGKNYDEVHLLAAALTDALDELWGVDPVYPVCLQSLLERLKPKSFTLTDCLEEYLRLRSIQEKPCRIAVETLIQLCGNRPVDSYTRRDARWLVDHLIARGNKTATVRRRIQSIRAICEYGLLEMETEKRNPFSQIPIPREGHDAKRRGIFSADQLQSIYEEALTSSRDTLLVLPILGETGARLAEIVGLRWADVDLEAGTIIIRPHALRPLKTRGSERVVPLVGVGLEAMTMLSLLSGDHEFVFSRWARSDRIVSTHASNTLNKALRKRFGDLTCHCFRHTFRDRLRDVEAPVELIDQIGGWTHAGGVGSRYGRGYSVDVQRKWLKKVAVANISCSKCR